ncbi:helix-turn-helix domain-containing protein [uncultured Herbaspirillum sp.]|uniref:helix-turn-helix domain-containing protein n=1 Tax=uncultured Herbaspirillum sp. TaxID=160236 RepID=UPI00261191F5|nr:helix-turn-helix domain-containing protein [uncultured Herbaspirillum sp.]
MLAPSCVISQEAIDELCNTADKKDLIHAGGGHSVIYGSDGSSLTPKIPEAEEGLLFAELDLGVISIAKSAADPAGHYARPDVTRLLLNPKRHRPVEFFSATGTSVQEAIFGDLSVEQIAFSLGFADAAYFTRFFQREVGKVPSQFRAEAR